MFAHGQGGQTNVALASLHPLIIKTIKQMSMTKAQMIDNLVIITEMKKKDVIKVLDGLTAMAYEYVKEDGEFTLPGLGKLVKVFRKERMGRNPSTGKIIKIKAKNVVKFKMQKALKDSVL